MSRALILTCAREEPINAKAAGRIRTTIEKAKEVRPFVEHLVTIAVKAKRAAGDAGNLVCSHARGSDEWKAWRKTEAGQTWLTAQAKYIQRQRQLFDVLRSRRVVSLLIDQVAPRFMDRPGGYTRVVRIAKRRLADGARLAYLEFVGEPTRLAVHGHR
jgi:large subunit ribosomal protein L17